MRFRKRVKIVKGISLNFSGTGTSLTLGGRGASINIGKKGTYLNTSIPSLGLYSREKISTNSKKASSKNYGSHKNIDNFSYRVDIDEKGKPIIEVIDNNNGLVLSDEKILRKIKSSATYKEQVQRLQQKRQEEIESNIAKFIDIHKMSPQIIDEKEVQNELLNLKLNQYTKLDFDKPKPTIVEVEKILEQEAKRKITSIFFWNNSKLQKRFIENNLQSTFDKLYKDWEEEKEIFEASEVNLEKMKNVDFQKEYDIKKTYLSGYLNGGEEFIEKEMDLILKSIELPVDFSIDYEYDTTKNILKIDLDLPEIEDLPTEKINILGSGSISIKQKNQKELRYDYATCVIGIAFFFSSVFFNISRNITKILISGYTQRLNKKNGLIEDNYIYSICFDKNILKFINIKSIDPIQAIENFEHTINITANYEMRSIKPF